MTKQDQIQEEIIEKTIKFYSDNEKGYLNLAMRVGKTRITLEVLKRMGYEVGQILIAYPDNKLKDVWEQECIKWQFNNFNIRMVNFSSLKKCNTQDYDVVICDEFHALSENEASLIQDLNASMWLFLSGTISGETKDKWPEFKEIANYSTLDGIEDGILANYQISVHLVKLDDKELSPNKKGKMLTEKKKYDNYSYVIQKMREEGRPTMPLALARNRLSLSSIGKMSYVKDMLSKMKHKRIVVFTGLAAVADGLGIPSYHSKSPNDFSFKAFQNKHINHIALAAMGKVGVSFVDLDCVILLNFVYSQEENAQILNRCIKLDYTDKIADMHIICLNEEPELKKIKQGLSMLDVNKVKYV